MALQTMAWQNLITDVAGVRVGHAHDARLGSGVTAVVFDEPAIASVDIRGGGPATRESDLLAPGRSVERVDAFALSGGSAFGIEAGGGVQALLREQGRGFAVGPARVPIVPGAALFDLLAGGDKDWGRHSPYRDLGYAAAAAVDIRFALGSGRGLGATTVELKGGLGSASAITADGVAIGALAAVNAAGSVVVGGGPCFWAGAFEQNGEFGGHGFPANVPAEALSARTKGSARESTTLVVVATDAVLTKAQAERVAIMAQTGLARAIYPVHTPLDGDILFAAATGRKPPRRPSGRSEARAPAANTVARAGPRHLRGGGAPHPDLYQAGVTSSLTANETSEGMGGDRSACVSDPPRIAFVKMFYERLEARRVLRIWRQPCA
jgi:D-aminopeptidase